MTYRSTGCDRDSYISGAARGGRGQFVFHDVNSRRDNLPNNVFQYLKDQVAREQYEAYIYQNQKANNQIDTTGKGRRIQGGDDVAKEQQFMEKVELNTERHMKLKQLYANEMRKWETELHARGLALEKRE